MTLHQKAATWAIVAVVTASMTIGILIGLRLAHPGEYWTALPALALVWLCQCWQASALRRLGRREGSAP